MFSEAEVLEGFAFSHKSFEKAGGDFPPPCTASLHGANSPAERAAGLFFLSRAVWWVFVSKRLLFKHQEAFLNVVMMERSVAEGLNSGGSPRGFNFGTHRVPSLVELRISVGIGVSPEPSKQISAECAQRIWETLRLGWEEDVRTYPGCSREVSPDPSSRRREREGGVGPLDGVTAAFEGEAPTGSVSVVPSTFSPRSRCCKRQLEPVRYRHGASFQKGRSKQQLLCLRGAKTQQGSC